MLRAHRQAWCWQDESYGLTMDDIRRLERETQLHLAQKMAASKAADGEGGEATPVATTPTNSAPAIVPKRPSKGDSSGHFTGMSTGGGDVTVEKGGNYSRSVSLDSHSSTSTLVNGGKAIRQARVRGSGEFHLSGVSKWQGQMTGQSRVVILDSRIYHNVMARWSIRPGSGGHFRFMYLQYVCIYTYTHACMYICLYAHLCVHLYVYLYV